MKAAGIHPADQLLPGDVLDFGGIVTDSVGQGAFVVLTYRHEGGDYAALIPRKLRISVNHR